MVAQKPSPVDCSCPIKANLNDSIADVERKGRRTNPFFFSALFTFFSRNSGGVMDLRVGVSGRRQIHALRDISKPFPRVQKAKGLLGI